MLTAACIFPALCLLSCGADMTLIEVNSGPYYYFTVTTVDQSNAESVFSNMVSVQQYNAGQYTLTWSQPLQYTNGDSVVPGDIKTYRVYAGVAPYVFIASFDVGTATTVVLSSLTPSLP
jgi:hypothetical protein